MSSKICIQIVKQIQSNVCAIKLHADSLNDADSQFFSQLRQMSESGQFVLFEDRWGLKLLASKIPYFKKVC
jgi:hypothetical protein